MKISAPHFHGQRIAQGTGGTPMPLPLAAASPANRHSSHLSHSSYGFTMIEIALCLAIIGFALISILLVLPTGMHTQRDTREETIINQDASMLIEAIRGGARGMDDLTNYVYAITNYQQDYNNTGKPIVSATASRTYGYLYN